MKWYMAKGNDAADKAAKQARVELHPDAAPGDLASARVFERDAPLVVAHLARSSARWPAVGARLSFDTDHVEEVRRRAAERREAARQQAQRKKELHIANWASHDWQVWRGHTRCRACWLRRGRAAASAPCAPSSGGLQQTCRRAVDCGHRLLLADFWAPDGLEPSGVLAVCTACGAWSFRDRSRKLHAQCSAPTRAGAQAVSRIRQG